MATAEEMELGRNIRRQFGRTSLDTTRMELTINKGVIYITGTIGPPKDEVGYYVKGEVGDVVLLIQKMPGVKQVVVGCKMVEQKKKEEKHAPGIP
ncbi:MAG: hypothetical protein P4L33_06370 [Capsulimonadaceae bacterium]|nr:hypothetical protein [Capsulimonadaceae bacterium]